MESRVYLCYKMNVGSCIKRIRFQTMQLSIHTTKPPNVHGNRYQTKGETDTYSYIEKRHHLILLNRKRKAMVMKKIKPVVHHNATL
jgi:hypothetical protein